MSNKTVNPEKEQEQHGPGLAAVEIVMKRTAHKACERARQVSSGVVILKDNQIVE